MSTTLSTTTPNTTTLDTTITERTTDRLTWTCPNCRCQTTTAKKRCTDCGTSRW